MNNVSKSIGWCDWTINPVKGLCPVGCSYCYARRVYNRNCNTTFRDKSIRYDRSVFFKLGESSPGDKIFVGSTIDLFHPLCSEWNSEIIHICSKWDDRIFIFLTKCPENLPKEWPDNCWVGVSIPSSTDLSRMQYLKSVSSKVKIISFEPLHSSMDNYFIDASLRQALNDFGIGWAIIGAQSPYSKKTAPKIEWVQEILVAASNANIPVFMKNNLQPVMDKTIFPGWAGWHLYQESPEKSK